MIFQRKDKKNEVDENLLSDFPPNSRFAESYRTLRTNLFFSIMEKDIKSIVVTSAVEKEGKTTTAVNLAYTMAQTDRRVLLVDCDLRRPHLTSLFSLKKEMGLTGLVSEIFGTRLTQGTLYDFSVSDLIQLTCLQKKSCRLDLSNSDNQVSIYFEKGLMADIYWKNRPESKKLANTLIQDKLLTENEARLALVHQKKSIQRLGTIIQTMGFVSSKDISKALSLHAIEAVRTVSAMTEGNFTFAQLSMKESNISMAQYVDFEKLYSEFSSNNEQFNFLGKTINAAIKQTDTKNLFILPSGAVPPNPSELLGSARTQSLMDYLKSRFDFIILDTPPVMPVTDALIMAPTTDGTVFVIRSGHADRKIIQDVINQFKKAKQPIIGSVLNRVDMNREGYYKYYKHYYSSYQ